MAIETNELQDLVDNPNETLDVEYKDLETEGAIAVEL